MTLLGRASLLQEVEQLLAQGQSVLLVGPEGIGKTALIEPLRRPAGVTVIDPFAQVSGARAAAIRRAMDRGAVFLAAARSRDRKTIGRVGRVLWRMRTVRVRPLCPRMIKYLLVRTLMLHCVARDEVAARWVYEAASLVDGRPGYAVGLVMCASTWRETHGGLPVPGFAFVDYLQRTNDPPKLESRTSQ